MLLEVNDMYGINQDMTDTIRHNLKVLPPEKEDPWAGGGKGDDLINELELFVVKD